MERKTLFLHGKTILREKKSNFPKLTDTFNELTIRILIGFGQTSEAYCK